MVLTYKTTFTYKKQLTESVYLFAFKLTSPAELSFTAGQYLMLRVQGKLRLYSIASPQQTKDGFEFIVDLVPGGLASEYLKALKEGDTVEFIGPNGQFILRDSPKTKIFMVTGTGIAPVRSILISNIKNQECYVYWGVRTYKDVYLLDELKNCVKSAGKMELKICLSQEKDLNVIPESDRKYFDLGHVNDCLDKQFNNIATEQLNNFEFYLCGAKKTVESLMQFLLSKGVLKENIYFERF